MCCGYLMSPCVDMCTRADACANACACACAYSTPFRVVSRRAVVDVVFFVCEPRESTRRKSFRRRLSVCTAERARRAKPAAHGPDGAPAARVNMKKKAVWSLFTHPPVHARIEPSAVWRAASSQQRGRALAPTAGCRIRRQPQCMQCQSQNACSGPQHAHARAAQSTQCSHSKTAALKISSRKKKNSTFFFAQRFFLGIFFGRF